MTIVAATCPPRPDGRWSRQPLGRPACAASGATVEVVDGSLGDAVGHKLLRSVLMKSLAAAVTEVRAGRAAGYEEWIRRQIAEELSGNGQQTIDRFLRAPSCTPSAAPRRWYAAAAYLEQLGIERVRLPWSDYAAAGLTPLR